MYELKNKKDKDSIPVERASYCRHCPLEALDIIESRLFGDNDCINVVVYARCAHADLCEELWNHLLDYEEEYGIDDDDDDNDDDEDEEWTWATGVKYEDMHG